MGSKFNYKNQIRHLEHLLIFLAVIYGYQWYIQSTSNFLIYVSLIATLTVLSINIEYIVLNSGMLIDYNSMKGLITIKRGEVILVINQSIDIEKVIYHRSRSLIFYRIRIFPTDEYHYCEIILKSGEKIFITSLIAPLFKLENYSNIELKQRLIAYVFSSKLPSPSVAMDKLT
jgi:hypothetical protein